MWEKQEEERKKANEAGQVGEDGKRSVPSNRECLDLRPATLLIARPPLSLSGVTSRYRPLIFWLHAPSEILDPRLDGRVDKMIDVRSAFFISSNAHVSRP